MFNLMLNGKKGGKKYIFESKLISIDIFDKEQFSISAVIDFYCYANFLLLNEGDFMLFRVSQLNDAFPIRSLTKWDFRRALIVLLLF